MRSEAPRPRVLAGRFVVDLGQAGDGVPLPALAGYETVIWALPVPRDSAHGTDAVLAVLAQDAQGQQALVWLDALGRPLAPPVTRETQGCSWASWLPESRQILAGCEPTGRPATVQRIGPLGDEWQILDRDVIDVPGFARGATEWRGAVVLASGRTHVVRRDPVSLQPLSTFAELVAPPGSVDRERLFLDHRDRLLVLDSSANRVEIWQASEAGPELVGLTPDLGRVLGPSRWDPRRRWLWVATDAGLLAIDPDRPDRMAWVIPAPPGARIGDLLTPEGDALVWLLWRQSATVGLVDPRVRRQIDEVSAGADRGATLVELGRPGR